MKEMGLKDNVLVSMRVMKKVRAISQLKATEERMKAQRELMEDRMKCEEMMAEMKVRAAELEIVKQEKEIELEELKAANAKLSQTNTHLTPQVTGDPANDEIEYGKVVVRMPETPKMQNKVDGIS